MTAIRWPVCGCDAVFIPHLKHSSVLEVILVIGPISSHIHSSLALYETPFRAQHLPYRVSCPKLGGFMAENSHSCTQGKMSLAQLMARQDNEKTIFIFVMW